MGAFFSTTALTNKAYLDGDGSRSDVAIVYSEGIVSNHIDEQIQIALSQAYWSEQRGAILANEESANDFAAIQRIETRARRFAQIVEMLSKRFGGVDQVFYFLDWYFKNKDNFVKVSFEDLLRYICPQSEIKQITPEELNSYAECTEKYCRSRRIASERYSAADIVLGFIFNTRSPLSLNYASIDSSNAEFIRSSVADMIKINEVLMQAGTIYMYCCPDYARIQRQDGTFEYKMDGLGSDIGLTAEKGIPAIITILQNMAARSSSPINIEIGTADFEATESNAQMVGESSVRNFEIKLGGSIRSMASELINQLGGNFEVNILEEDNSDTIGSVRIDISFNGRVIAFVNFSRISQKQVGQIEGYDGKKTFDQLVEARREELAARALEDRSFQRKLDKLIQVRISLMIKWTNLDDPTVPETVKQFYSMFREIENARFGNIVEVLKRYGFQFKFTEDKPTIEDYSIEDREEVLRIIAVKEIFSGKPEMVEVLNYLRTKVARQGAEYSVMHELMRYNDKTVHLVADAMNMWQVFGISDINILGVKGGYDGAKALPEG